MPPASIGGIEARRRNGSVPCSSSDRIDRAAFFTRAPGPATLARPRSPPASKGGNREDSDVEYDDQKCSHHPLSKEHPMRTIVAGLFISLDGVFESPDKWHFPYFNDEMGEAVGAQMAESDA